MSLIQTPLGLKDRFNQQSSFRNFAGGLFRSKGMLDLNDYRGRWGYLIQEGRSEGGREGGKDGGR